jgi:DNA mismatch endonuclease (patch repair protein)
VADVHTQAQRSFNMSRIRGTDTTPERAVRRLVSSLGYRYRLNVRSLPGKPDLVFRAARKIILVHGCFWHRHNCRYGRVQPRTRSDFWTAKFSANKHRDQKVRCLLAAEGWNVLVVWECQLKREDKLKARIALFLKKDPDQQGRGEEA